MIKRVLLFILFTFFSLLNAQTIELREWRFANVDIAQAAQVDFDDAAWERVTVPHDWAIYGPFDQEIDKQMVRITQNGEKVASEKTGRTGALPFIGVGWYRTKVDVVNQAVDIQTLIAFDGAMSNAEVFVNGQKVGHWPNGYNYFYFDISEHIVPGENLIAVRLENYPFSSRWYPGAGLYRKVRLITKNRESFKHWGHYITTPFIGKDLAKVSIRSQVQGQDLQVVAQIVDSEGNVLIEQEGAQRFGDEIETLLSLPEPKLWSPESPYLYTARMLLKKKGLVVDQNEVRFGVRSIQYSAEKGFELNGQVTKFKGVCLHHDLGPIGTAVNKAALRRQLTILKDMGCNAVRSAHNMPSIEQLELCDEMGFLFLAESFDEWKKPKVKNGYNLYFDEWAEKDIVNLVRATRNHPCIVMWSAGNEVPDQWGSEGVKRLRFLQDVFHREDPTRPVTVGMDQVKATMKSGFGAVLDIPGLNYRVHLYDEAYEKFPQGLLLGSETASTVSSRGVYKFPVVKAKGKTYDDLRCSSYDLEYCSWSNIPEEDFVVQDDKPWVIGEFVWTGFDYLGEPTPYDRYWPSRSSYFGICDLAGLPKDRYYLYRSRWNTEDETLHILPHWNWEGREGEVTPVFVYTSYKKAELFVNGVSQGMREKNDSTKLDRYRLMWMDVKYQAGTVKVVAYDDNDQAVAEKSIQTAGKPHHILLETDRTTLKADGEDLCYVTASVVDKDGNLCPHADHRLYFEVKGDGTYRAACNGDATSLELFHQDNMKTFSGQLVITLQATAELGDVNLKVRSKGLKSATLKLSSE